MAITERDYEVCEAAARRLLAESLDRFQEAHEAAMRGFEERTFEESLESFGRAIECGREVIELQGRLIAVRAQRLARRRAGSEERRAKTTAAPASGSRDAAA